MMRNIHPDCLYVHISVNGHHISTCWFLCFETMFAIKYCEYIIKYLILAITLGPNSATLALGANYTFQVISMIQCV